MKQHNTLYYYFSNNINTSNVYRIAGFDLDWTLIKPRYAKFPTNPDDIVVMPNRISTLNKLIKDNYTIVIFSNQKLTNKEPLDFKLKRMDNVIKIFEQNNIPIILLMAIADDEYRKPNIGMWTFLREKCPNIKEALYCGDAAGRPNDFSDSDKQFAQNIRINFYIPELVFTS